MTIDMSQFYQVFFDEAEELLAEKEKLLLAVDISAPDTEDLNAIFRAAHSIKGGAATFGFTDITEVTHMLESLLDRIRKGEMALTAEHVDAFLAAKDILTMQMDGHRHGASVDQDAVNAYAAVACAVTGRRPKCSCCGVTCLTSRQKQEAESTRFKAGRLPAVFASNCLRCPSAM